MTDIKIDFTKVTGKIKPMHAVNNGPAGSSVRKGNSTFDYFREAGIPYARNHDASFYTGYGSEYTVDVHRIFTDFNADPYNPESYDFECTDEYVKNTFSVGTEVFYRLGSSIEHGKKKGTFPPPDFEKWAVICEHIIRHYNEGWANGFEYGIEYWEIWNEPDCTNADGSNPCWQGTQEQFIELFSVAAKHLKSCFPNLKIGGPALAGKVDWANDFLCEMQKREVEIDFFSWHVYMKFPQKMLDKAAAIKELLVKYGYENAESILNEWNYVKDWREYFAYSIETIIGAKGAAFTASVICSAQRSSIDMLMYYDTRPSVFNGIFDYYTYRKLKGYYALYWYGKFYDTEREILPECLPDDVYAICGEDKDGKLTAMVTYYSDEELENKKLAVDFGKAGEYEVYLTDPDHDGELIAVTDKIELDLKLHSIVFIKEK